MGLCYDRSLQTVKGGEITEKADVCIHSSSFNNRLC